LQKVLASAGLGSRRACEELITQGRVTIDGQVVRELGTRVDPNHARIALDGEPIRQERHVYFAVNKPKGYVSTNNDPAGKPKVVDLLPEIPQRVYTVGRLDEQSTGLMILTNDGELANRLAHPKFGVEKVYRVVVAGSPDRSVFDKLVEGVWLAEGKVRAKRVRPVARRGEATVLEMTLAEGKNREVRRMLAQLGHKVMSLTRVSVGPVALKGLLVGDYRPLSAYEVDLLRKVAAGISVPSPKFADRRPRIPRSGGAPADPETAGPRDRERVRTRASETDRPTSRPPTRPHPAHGGRPRPVQDAQESRTDRPRVPRPAGAGPRPPQNAGPRPPQNAGPRPPQNSGPRPPQNAGPRPPQYPAPRPPQNAGPRPPQRPSGPPAGIVRKPRSEASAPSTVPLPQNRPKPPARSQEDGPRRIIIGLDQAVPSVPDRGGPPGPRRKRPVPKRSPRASFGMNRKPGGGEPAEGADKS
jgi:23S rRNA pseudouridine2605 synthase